METFLKFTTLADNFTVWVAVATLGFTLNNWLNDRKNNVDIPIELTHADEPPIRLAQTIKRRHLTRSEVQGVLANAYHHPDNPKARYDIPFFASKAFSEHLESVQDGKKDMLSIEISNKDEFSAFHNKD